LGRISWSEVLKVARWEFSRAVRHPLFAIMTLLIPLVMVLSGGAGLMVERMTQAQELEVAVIDEMGSAYSFLAAHLKGSPVTLIDYAGSRQQAEADLKAGRLDGFLVLDAQAVKSGRIPYYVDKVRVAELRVLKTTLIGALTAYRLQQLGLTPDQLAAVMVPVTVEPVPIGEAEGEPAALAVAPMIVAGVLIMSALLPGQVLMYGVIKEKRNRIVEILLSSISSTDLMVGKILGFGALSLLQVTIWVSAGVLIASRFMDLGQLGLSLADFLPSLPYFLLGYLLLASLFATIGATMKEAEGGSQAHGLVVIIPMVPLFVIPVIMMNPNALWVRVLSHVPPFIPATMLLRLAVTRVAVWEMLTSLTILACSVVFFIHLGARIFKEGILQFDRALTLRDLRALLGKRQQPGS